MRVRILRYSDIPVLEELHKKANYAFPFPDLSSPLYIIRGVAEDDGEIIGAGFIKLTSEAVMILDKDRSARELSSALDELILTGQALTIKSGIQAWHVFLDDDTFYEQLKKHYGFIDAAKHALYLDIGAR